MRTVITMAKADPITEICADVYRGQCIFGETGWSAIAVAVAQELIPGQSIVQFVGDQVVPQDIDWKALEEMSSVTGSRLYVTALVAPAVLAAAQRAHAECWTVDELVAAVNAFVNQYRPRVEWLAALQRRPRPQS